MRKQILNMERRLWLIFANRSRYRVAKNRLVGVLRSEVMVVVPAALRDPNTGQMKLPWHEVFEQNDPELFAAYKAWAGYVASPKELDLKSRELMVVAIDSLVAWPSPFIDVHIHGAFDAGATVQEVIEAITVAAGFGGGHAYNHGLTALGSVLKERRAANVPTPQRREA